MRPINPPHPVPHTLLLHTLKLKNETRSDGYAIIYVRNACGVYEEYRKKAVPAGQTIAEIGPYYANDHLLVKTWLRGAPTAPWQCRCNHLIRLEGAASTFNVVNCTHTP